MERSSEAIYPLTAGKAESRNYSGQNDKGHTWSGVRKCKIEETVNVTVPAGSFDTYHVVCSEGSSRRHWYFAPELGTPVAFRQVPVGGSSSAPRHNELVRLEPAG